MPDSSRLFDVYIAVDWSSRAKPSPVKPSKDAIWLAEAQVQDQAAVVNVHYYRTRWAALEALELSLLQYIEAGQRVFIGFDFAYGFPQGYTEALELAGDAPPWRLIWNKLARMVEDEPNNANNRFSVASLLNAQEHLWSAGPFWGCPPVEQTPTLASTSPVFPYQTAQGIVLERLRWTDRMTKGVQPVWKLYGAGSVGSQSLVGIPAVHWLRFNPRFESISQVWPFETGFTATPIPSNGPFILHAEIWPGVVPFDHNDPIPDRAQVQAMVEWMYTLDQAGALGRLFDTPPNLPSAGILAATQAEGWLLGAGTK